MTDTPREIAEDLLSELRELECVRGEISHLLEWPDALELLTAYGAAQFKAGQEDMRERCETLAKETPRRLGYTADRYFYGRAAADSIADTIAALKAREAEDG